jgi:hypothetical protein
MTVPILDRLNARIADDIDIQDAHDEIIALLQENTNLKDMLSSQPAPAAAPVVHALPARAVGNFGEVITLLTDAKERLGVNALSSVGDYIDRSIKILGG